MEEGLQSVVQGNTALCKGGSGLADSERELVDEVLLKLWVRPEAEEEIVIPSSDDIPVVAVEVWSTFLADEGQFNPDCIILFFLRCTICLRISVAQTVPSETTASMI